MKYIIYMDVFFMVNALMDTVLLKLAAFYIKPQTTFLRCMVGGAVGGILSCISMLLPYKNMLVHTLYSYIFIALVMGFVTFGKSDVKQLIRRTTILYMASIVLGGGMNLLYDYTYFGYIVQGILGTIYANPLNLLRIALYACVSYAMINCVMRLWQSKRLKRNFVKVELKLKGQSVIVKGLIDSGNSLNDPYYGKIVHIVEYDSLQRILEGVDIHKERYRLVPFHSLGQRNGLIEVVEFEEMLVSSIDEVYFYDNNERKGVLYKEKSPAIGLYHGYLSGDNKYKMLLHSNVESMI